MTKFCKSSDIITCYLRAKILAFWTIILQQTWSRTPKVTRADVNFCSKKEGTLKDKKKVFYCSVHTSLNIFIYLFIYFSFPFQFTLIYCSVHTRSNIHIKMINN